MKSDLAKRPISFICCWHDREILNRCLLPSLPLVETDQLILLHGADASLSAGYAEGEEMAEHDLLIFLHSDMWLPPDWRQHLMEQLLLVEQRDAAWGLIGLFGACWDCDGTMLTGIRTYGHVADRGALWNHGVKDLPCQVDVLDSIMIMKRKGILHFDKNVPTIQGVSEDICLSAKQMNRSIWAVNAFAEHYSSQAASSQYDGDLQQAAGYLVAKWAQHIPSTTKLWEHSLAILEGGSVEEVCSKLDHQLSAVVEM